MLPSQRRRTPSPATPALSQGSAHLKGLHFSKRPRVDEDHMHDPDSADVEMAGLSSIYLPSPNTISIEPQATGDGRLHCPNHVYQSLLPALEVSSSKDAEEQVDTPASPPESLSSNFPPDIVLARIIEPANSKLMFPFFIRGLYIDGWSLVGHVHLSEQQNMPWAHGIAHAFTANRTHCITALNVPWVPQLVVGTVDIAMRADGRFGVEDLLNWPQLYSPSRPYLAFLPKMPKPSSWATPLWENAHPHHFVRASDELSGRAFGYLSSSRLGTLWDIVARMNDTVEEFKQSSAHQETAILDEVVGLQDAMHNTLMMFAISSTYRDVV